MTEEVSIIRRKLSETHYQVQVRWPGTQWVDLYQVIEHKGRPAPWGVHWISGATGEVSLVHRFLTQTAAMFFVDRTIAKHIELEGER